jgi:hypothetical protein
MFTPSSWLWILLLVLVLCIYVFYPQIRRSGVERAPKYVVGDDAKEAADKFEIGPLPDFDWRVTEPLKFRQFKDKYHLTMGMLFYLTTWVGFANYNIRLNKHYILGVCSNG